MATSNSFDFAPNVAELIMQAYARIQIRGPQLMQEHLDTGRQEANLWLASIANQGPSLFTVDLISETLVQGTKTYDVPASTVMILDPFVETTDGITPISRTISPLSRTDYAGIANKDQQGQPTSFWFDRLIAPTITMWPVPDANGPYTLRYYRYRQMQDANLGGGENIELPYRFLDAFVAGLAYRLACIWNPGLEDKRLMAADKAWAICATQDTENVSMTISCGLASYFN